MEDHNEPKIEDSLNIEDVLKDLKSPTKRMYMLLKIIQTKYNELMRIIRIFKNEYALMDSLEKTIPNDIKDDFSGSVKWKFDD